MPSKFEIIAEGYLGKDAEEGTTNNGKPTVKFRIACKTGKKDNETTHWIFCNAYSYACEQAKHFKKGDLVRVEGEPGAFVLFESVEQGADSTPVAKLAITTFRTYKIDWVKRETQEQPAAPQGGFGSGQVSNPAPASFNPPPQQGGFGG